MSTRKELYLNAMAEKTETIPIPITREDYYLAFMCGMKDLAIENLPLPITREEHYLYEIAKNPKGGSVIEIANYSVSKVQLNIEEPQPLEQAAITTQTKTINIVEIKSSIELINTPPTT